MKRVEVYVSWVLVIIFCLWSITPLIHPGFFVSDDGDWMIIRLSAFHQALASGQFPVRWLSRLDFGYGYPVSNFLYPGLMYLGEIIHLFHVSFVHSIKIVIALSMVGSGIFSFLWLRRFFSPIVACIGALFYLFSPYHLYDLYTRGSLGEILAMAVVMFILWQIERKSFFFSTLGIGFLLTSHNTLAFLFFPFIVAYFILRKKELPMSWRQVILSVGLGVGLATFFWLPALYDLRYTIFSQTVISEWQSYFASIWLIQPFIVGIIITAIFIIQDRGNFRREILPLFFLCVTVVPLFFATSISSIFWPYLPISFIQFPFRLVSLSLVGGAFLSSYLLAHAKKSRPFWVIFTIITLVISGVPFMTPKSYTLYEEGFYTTNEDSTTVRREYTPIWVKEKPFEHASYPFMTSPAMGTVDVGIVNSKRAEVTLSLDGPGQLQFFQHYFPGWNAFIDGKQVPIRIEEKSGNMIVDYQSGNHTITFVFSETPLRLFADIVSLVSLVGLGVWVFLIERRAKKSL